MDIHCTLVHDLACCLGL